MNSILVVVVALAWVLILAGSWLGWQLLRQNGRLLLRIESLEERLNEMEFGDASAPEGLPIGSAAPEFDLPDLTGERRTLAQLRSQPLLLIFFNPECGFCREMIPKLAGLDPHHVGQAFEPASSPDFPVRSSEQATGKSPAPADRNVRPTPEVRFLTSAATNERPLPLLITTGDAEKNRQFFSDHKIASPVLLQNDSEVAKAYQAAGTPTGYLISADGKIASPLAIGAEALLELAEKPFAPLSPSLSPSDGERVSAGRERGEPAATEAEDRAARFGKRSLARSRIARNGLKAGTPAPAFRLPRLDGGELALEDLRGHKVLLVFSDPHCGPCQALAPRLEQLHRQRPELRVVMISRGEPRDNRAKVKQHKLTFPIVLQQQWEISRRYAMFATPIAYLIDERGIIIRDIAMGESGIMELVTKPANPQRAEVGMVG